MQNQGGYIGICHTSVYDGIEMVPKDMDEFGRNGSTLYRTTKDANAPTKLNQLENEQMMLAQILKERETKFGEIGADKGEKGKYEREEQFETN